MNTQYTFLADDREPFSLWGLGLVRFPVPNHVVAEVRSGWSHGFPYNRTLNDFYNYALDLVGRDKSMIPHCLPILCIVTYIMGADLKQKCHRLLATTTDYANPAFLAEYNETLKFGIGILGQATLAADKWTDAPTYFQYNTHWHLGSLWMLAHDESRAEQEFLTVVKYCGDNDIVADAWIALAHLAEKRGDLPTREAWLEDFIARVTRLFPHQKEEFIKRALSDDFVKQSRYMQEYFQKHR